MSNKNDPVLDLYEEAIYWHLVHKGQKIDRKNFKIFWSDKE